MTNTLGGRLRFIRHTSRKDFASKYGIHEQSLVRYENDARQPDQNLIRMIAKGEGVSFDWLLHGVGPMIFDELKKVRPVGQNFDGPLTQHLENFEKDLNENCRQSAVLKLQQEIIELLKEKNALTEKTASLQIQLKERDQRIKELEKEIERLRGELALAKSRAAGVQAG